MAREKAISTQLKEAKAKIEQLEKERDRHEQYEKMYRESSQKLEAEIQSVHVVLDTLGVPRKYKREGYCGEETMPLASRLFAWTAGARVKADESV